MWSGHGSRKLLIKLQRLEWSKESDRWMIAWSVFVLGMWGVLKLDIPLKMLYLQGHPSHENYMAVLSSICPMTMTYVFRNGRVWCDKLFIAYPDNMLNEHNTLRTALEICMHCAYETPQINQFNQLTNQPISQTADPSIYPSIHACTNQSALQSVAQCRWSVDFSAHSANNQPTNQLSNEPTSQPTNQSFNPVRPRYLAVGSVNDLWLTTAVSTIQSMEEIWRNRVFGVQTQLYLCSWPQCCLMFTFHFFRWTHTHNHIYIYIYTYTYMYIHIYIYIYIYTRNAWVLPRRCSVEISHSQTNDVANYRNSYGENNKCTRDY